MHFDVHMIAFLPDTVGEAKAIEYLQAATLEPIGLAVEDLGSTLVNYTGAQIEARGPSSSHEAVHWIRFGS